MYVLRQCALRPKGITPRPAQKAQSFQLLKGRDDRLGGMEAARTIAFDDSASAEEVEGFCKLSDPDTPGSQIWLRNKDAHHQAAPA